MISHQVYWLFWHFQSIIKPNQWILVIVNFSLRIFISLICSLFSFPFVYITYLWISPNSWWPCEWVMSATSCLQQPCSAPVESYQWLLLWSQFISYLVFLFSYCLLYSQDFFSTFISYLLTHYNTLFFIYLNTFFVLKPFFIGKIEQWVAWEK